MIRASVALAATLLRAAGTSDARAAHGPDDHQDVGTIARLRIRG